jgi:hypothetical protein
MPPRTGLVIGIHQQELDFGRQVASILPAKDIRIIQIDQGLPQQDSFKDRGYYYSIYHQEIYLQLHQQIKNKVDLLMELHTGINEAGRCTDIFCGDRVLLDRLKNTFSQMMNQTGQYPALRIFKISRPSAKAQADSGCFPVCHTIIPCRVWESPNYAYVGVEVYLTEAGKGRPADWRYGAELIEGVIRSCYHCA